MMELKVERKCSRDISDEMLGRCYIIRTDEGRSYISDTKPKLVGKFLTIINPATQRVHEVNTLNILTVSNGFYHLVIHRHAEHTYSRGDHIIITINCYAYHLDSDVYNLNLVETRIESTWDPTSIDEVTISSDRYYEIIK